MSGHSKWANIKHKKGKADAARGKIFTKIGREIAIAVRDGGSDPAVNGKLRDLISKAKSLNVPNDNIDRIIKKFSANDDLVYEEITYEGYGPSGVAVIVETATDNRNRTAGNIRSYFAKFHGNMGQSGCVSFMFEEKGVIYVADDEDTEIDEDALMDAALEAGASDVLSEEVGCFEVYTEPADLEAVRDALKAAGFPIQSAELEKVPSSYTALTGEEDIKMMELLLEKLEDDDDVQNVWHNWENN